MCDTLAAVGSATADGIVLFGKNSDREFNEAQYLEWIPEARHEAGARVRLTYKDIDQARQTHTVLLSKPHWIWGAEIGANSRGLTIGNEALFAKIPASPGEGIIGMDYLRLALERAGDVDEAIHVITTLLRQHGQAGNCGFRRELAYHNSFILADPQGAKVLETVDREWVVTSVRSHYAISNAMTIEAAFERSSPSLGARATQAGLYETSAPFGFKSVYEDCVRSISGNYRHGRVTRMLNFGIGSLRDKDIFRILRDHQEGPPIEGRANPRICAHSQENPIGQTTASWVASLTSDKCVHWVTGTAAPCTGLFKPVLVEAGLPDHGPKPGANEDAACLWWRHEQLRHYLDGSERADRDAFFEERSALEVRFRETLAACPPVTDDSSRDEARRIVESCWCDGLDFESRWHERLRANRCAGKTGIEDRLRPSAALEQE